MYFLLAAIIFIIGYGMYAIIFSSIDDIKRKKTIEKAEKLGIMYGIFYKLNEDTDLFIVKTYSYNDSLDLIDQVSHDLQKGILSHSDFKKQTGLMVFKENFYIKKVPINEKPYPSYSNYGIQYEEETTSL